MPTYVYECTKCNHRFEASQSITAKPLIKCPKCKKSLRCLIGSGGGIIFKGSGFYANDYRKKSKKETGNPKVSSCPKSGQGCDGCTPNK